MRETKRFLIDNVSHYPDLKLEWISIDEDDRVDQLLRVRAEEQQQADGDDGKEAKKDKGKGAQPPPAVGTVVEGSSGLEFNLDINALLAAELAEEAGGESSSDDEDEDEGYGLHGQKIETIEGLQFCDIDGITIFKKEIVAGRL